MIIGIDISQIVYKTGVSRYTMELVRNLLKTDKNNQYKLYAGAVRQMPEIFRFLDELKSSGYVFKSYVFPIPPKLAEKFWNRWRPILIEQLIGGIDIFHCSDWTQPRTKAKKVTTLHDLTPVLYSKYHTRYVVDTFTYNLKLIENEADAVITVSKSTLEDAALHTKLERSRMHVVYSGVSDLFSKRSDDEISEVKRKYKLDKPYVLSVGTKEPRKNINRLIDAFLSLGGSDVELVIAGKYGWGESGGKGPDSSNNIREIGFVNDNDLPALYSGALAFVYPSLYEGFGMPVLEAMSCGCPVITSNISSLPEVAGDSALLVYPKDTKEITNALHTMINNEALRNQLRKKGLERIRKFSWEDTARSTLSVYESISSSE